MSPGQDERFARQLPLEYGFLPGTGSYPFQHRPPLRLPLLERFRDELGAFLFEAAMRPLR